HPLREDLVATVSGHTIAQLSGERIDIPFKLPREDQRDARLLAFEAVGVKRPVLDDALVDGPRNGDRATGPETALWRRELVRETDGDARTDGAAKRLQPSGEARAC